MPALSYNGRFVEYVENGLTLLSPQFDGTLASKLPRVPKPGGRIKRQTIRGFRKYPFKVGNKLYHYFAQRNAKLCRKLGESICTAVHPIRISRKGIRIYDYTHDMVKESQFTTITKSYLYFENREWLDHFAFADGFSCWEEMRKWWVLTHGAKCFPFVGQLIKW